MPTFESTPAPIVAVTGSVRNKRYNLVWLDVEDNRGVTSKLAIGVEAFGALIVVLQAAWNELAADLRDDKRPVVQTLPVSSVEVAHNEEGQVALLLMLQGGGELPLLAEPSALEYLRGQLDEAIAAARDRRH